MNRGEILDNTYQIIEEIGSGAGGIVYKAFHIRLQKYVVVKKIKDNFLGRIESRSEVDILKRLHHPYLPQVYDFIQQGSQIFTVMDFVDGQDMQKLLNQGWQFGEEQLLIWLEQLAQVLAYLHSQAPCIIHSDIKPSNIMVTERGDICLIDFNISLDGEQDRLIGLSEHYAAPEQIQKAAMIPSGADSRAVTIDKRIDIYSLGAVFYRLMTGIVPNVQLIYEQPLRQIGTGYSSGLEHIVDKCLHMIPAKRYQSAEELLLALHSIEKQGEGYRRIMLMFAGGVCCGTLLLLLGIGCIIFGIRLKNREAFQTEYDSFCRAVEAWDSREIVSEGQRLTSRDVYSIAGSDDEFAQIYYYMGLAYWQDGESMWAETHLQKAVLQSGDNVKRTRYFMDWMRILLEDGNSDLAAQMLQHSEEYDVDEEQLAYLRGMVYYEQNDYDNAFQLFRTALQTTSDEELKALIYKQMGEIYWIQGNYPESIAMLELAGGCKAERNTLRELAEVCTEYSRQAVDSSVAREFRKRAIQLYQQLGGSLAPAFLDRMNLVVLYMLDGEYTAAESILKELAKEYSDYRIDMYLAYIAYDRGRVDNMQHFYERANKAWIQAGNPSDENMEQLKLLIEEQQGEVR